MPAQFRLVPYRYYVRRNRTARIDFPRWPGPAVGRSYRRIAARSC